MTGIEVVEWLQTRKFPGLKIVMLADSSSAIYRPKALSLGIKHFYSKAVNTAELVHVVKTLQAELDDPGDKPPTLTPTEIPPLILDDLRFESNGMPNLVIWGNLEVSRFMTFAGAKAAVSSQYYTKKDSRSLGARLFAWDGKSWKQTLS
jgi:hypothetical protein